MFGQFNNLTVRNAAAEDADLLSAWWNDGKIMAHAGFPDGTGETPLCIARKISEDVEGICRRLIIEYDRIPIGEMSYFNVGNDTAEIGIKICDFSKQGKGYGKIYLSMLIRCLFSKYGYKKIILDTNLNNTRAQHVYETLGFRKIRVKNNSWKNQFGELQSSVDYELVEENFNDFSIINKQ
ncbi:MAG: GNAT family N-acetyltransferase [Lachnospiraceae bacterium]|jgi:RimJ/RimL family protein N-acetyltransferase|nr:GNAT family N-acetyltransferase [Lachnospiraceae bacterium]